ncbi:hypothetical protein BDV25DRAFT_163432 [Aspergillus avenaceus]|uniref:Uncharacterized protein n=1 Tax=Aspergillus avenaceus TaxID=36643 RepID=A0A5N6THZ3_ASPAV|nr:hypothetical protein BDV25DRAFT_163432 [Aspergillus avenaceus]
MNFPKSTPRRRLGVQIVTVGVHLSSQLTPTSYTSFTTNVYQTGKPFHTFPLPESVTAEAP